MQLVQLNHCEQMRKDNTDCLNKAICMFQKTAIFMTRSAIVDSQMFLDDA